VTDGWTEEQNYDSQDRASIAASHGKKLTQLPNGAGKEMFATLIKLN